MWRAKSVARTPRREMGAESSAQDSMKTTGWVLLMHASTSAATVATIVSPT
jgi:hypothetical protein